MRLILVLFAAVTLLAQSPTQLPPKPAAAGNADTVTSISGHASTELSDTASLQYIAPSTTLPTAAAAKLGYVYTWTRAVSENGCPAAGASGGSTGTAVAKCYTVDNAAWRAQIGADTSGNLLIGPTVLDATAGFLARVTVWNTSTCAPVSTGFTLNNSAGAMGCTLPTITSANVGLQLCFRNSVTRTGAITLTAPASTYFDVSGAVGSAAGTLVSGGALGDAACVVAVDTTHYYAFVGVGTWTNN